MSTTRISFPDHFIWGTSTAAYQIEGAFDEDGRGSSIWDKFCHTEGKIYKSQNGDIAADHYHRWKEDIQLISDLGLGAYRFSISWSRILPEGKGKLNLKGLDFYDRLVDELLMHGIQPFPTLYHWDLPQALQEIGGWANREVVYYFADYTHLVENRLGDRVSQWITHNEPFVMAFAGHFTGEHAPGIKNISTALQVAHHLLLSHGLAVQAIQAGQKETTQVGITLDLSPIHPASNDEKDKEAAVFFDAFKNCLFLDPIFRGKYPEVATRVFESHFSDSKIIKPNDFQIIASSIDFLGVNYYSRIVIGFDPNSPTYNLNFVKPKGNDYSLMWEVYPQGIYEILAWVWQDYHPKAIYITENGIPVPDDLDFDGKIRDYRRIWYLEDHISQVHKALKAGVPLRGYFVWSLLDNFEWTYGYRMRFGLVFVDFETQERHIKESGYWYSRVACENGIREFQQHKKQLVT